MACKLVADPKIQSLQGVTLTSSAKCFGFFTGVYLSAPREKAVATAKAESKDDKPVPEKLNVVVWLHGYEVPNIAQLFTANSSKIRESVANSGKDVVLIAPFMGFRHNIGKDGNTVWDGPFDYTNFSAKNGGETYLDTVLRALAEFRNPSVESPPIPEVKNLVLAAHSGGGAAMRALVGSLGKYQAALRECWAFDCLYNTGSPDTANFWFDETKKGFHLYGWYGPSTVWQAIKLFLMAQGAANSDGAKLDPPGGKNDKVHIAVGYDVAALGAAAGANPDDFANLGAAREMADPIPPKHRGKDYNKGSFAYQAAANLQFKHAWPADVHYFIARSFFLASLKRLF
jgi:hypothetical protein